MGSEAGWEVIVGDLTDPRIVELLETHVAAARATLPRESCHAFDVSALQKPGLSFWAIWDGPAVAGMGALMDLGEGHGEVKSMHTASTARGRGVGAAMLCHIVATARARAYRRLSLETGATDYFAAARALYARHGFTECGPFGSYGPDPNSVFLTRAI